MSSPPAPSAQLRDPRNQRLGTAVAAAADAAESALARMLSFQGRPEPELDAAIAADPGWGLPWLMKAGLCLAQDEARLLPQAEALLAHAAPLCASAPPREQAHLAALQAVAEGRWSQACRTWDELLLGHPRDALALHWAQHWDLCLGDTASLRLRPAQALPEWDEADPLFPQVLGLYAFGLEENNLYPQAEDVGRRAVNASPSAPWAVHAVAHALDMQGRFEDGTAWLRQHQPRWAEDNHFAAHLWWHMALFRLEALDIAGVHRLVDAHLSGGADLTLAQRLDAASLLWRMHLLDQDVGARFVQLLQEAPPAPEEAGHWAFHDVHLMLAWLGAGELVQAEAWLARCAARALQPQEARRSNHAVAREVGLPLMRGLLALARGEADQAVAQLQAVRPQWRRLGGSHVQRDVFDQTLMAAAARATHAPVGRALLNERLMAKPATPLTRHWAERLRLSLL